MGNFGRDTVDVYDEEYFAKYQGYEVTEIGRLLTQARKNFVTSLIDGNEYSNTIVDVGVGSGQFVRALDGCLGTDINPVALAMLADEGRLWEGDGKVDYMTFWDSLEHIPDPTSLLSKVRKGVFISCPIYQDMEHALSSKHFRKDEHFWYWTLTGLDKFMDHFGFKVVSQSRFEQEYGREGIASFFYVRS